MRKMNEDDIPKVIATVVPILLFSAAVIIIYSIRSNCSDLKCPDRFVPKVIDYQCVCVIKPEPPRLDPH